MRGFDRRARCRDIDSGLPARWPASASHVNSALMITIDWYWLLGRSVL